MIMIVLKLEKNQRENNEGYVRFDILAVRSEYSIGKNCPKYNPTLVKS